MPNVNVTYQEMKDAAQRLRNGKAEIENQLSQLKKQVDNLIASGYVTDSSSVQFGSSYEEFNTGVTKTIQGLDGMGQYLTTAADTFQQADQQLARGLAG